MNYTNQLRIRTYSTALVYCTRAASKGFASKHSSMKLDRRSSSRSSMPMLGPTSTGSSQGAPLDPLIRNSLDSVDIREESHPHSLM